MDPLIHLLTQTQRNMLDNTQKSSDSLRTQQDKELKAKKSRASSVDLADLSADCNQMGEDLLGSMDPDLFGRSGGAEAFKKRWEEMISEEEVAEEEEEEAEPDPDGHDDGDRAESDLQEDLQDEESHPSVVVDEEVELEELEHGRWGSYREGESEKQEDVEPQKPEPEAPLDSVALEAPSDGRDGPERLELAPEESGPDAEAAGKRRGGWSSLLDHGEGFLIAEERQDAEEEFDELPEHEAAVQVSPTLAALTAKLIVGGVGSRAYLRLQSMLARFGAGVLRLCLDEKVKVYLLPQGTGLTSHPGVSASLGDAPLCSAVYIPESRGCVIEEECLLQAPRHFHPVLYYFALAFDHALGDGGFASLKSPAVSANFQACSEGLKGHQFADPLAETTPAHYFAQAVEAYLQESDCSDPIWTRDDLYDFDRSMFDYVEYLFRRQNR